MVLSAKMSTQSWTVSGSKGSLAEYFFVMKSGSRRDPQFRHYEGISVWRRADEDVIDALVDKNIQLSIHSFDTFLRLLSRRLHPSHPFEVCVRISNGIFGTTGGY